MEKFNILKKALDLLNQRGYCQTNTFDLIAGIGITKEEFNQFFNNSDEVVEALFYQLCDKSDEVTRDLDKSGPLISLLYKLTLASYEIQIEYKFIFLEFYKILKSIDSIKDRYFALIALRKTQLIHFFQLLIEAGSFRPEFVPGQFENLTNQMTMLSDYWLTHNYLIFGEKCNSHFYARMIYTLILPYLTEKGLLEFTDYIPDFPE